MNNKILVIKPQNINLLKTIYNYLLLDTLNIIIIGNKNDIKSKCEIINLDYNILNIDSCEDDLLIYEKVNNYIKTENIKGIIIDNLEEKNILELFDNYTSCYMVDYKLFRKSIFVIEDNNYVSNYLNIKEIINLMDSLDIKKIKMAIVYKNKKKAVNIYKQIKEIFQLNKVNIINKIKPNKTKYNLIIFEDYDLQNKFINNNTNRLTKVVQFKKISNTLIFNIENISFKNIFFQFLIVSKIKQ